MTEATPREDHHKNGSVSARGFELDGELHGYWEWYRVDGSVMRSGAFDRGRQVGVWTTYEPGGASYKETRFPD